MLSSDKHFDAIIAEKPQLETFFAASLIKFDRTVVNHQDGESRLKTEVEGLEL